MGVPRNRFVDVIDYKREVREVGGRSRKREVVRYIVRLGCGHEKTVQKAPVTGVALCTEGCVVSAQHAKTRQGK